MEPQFHFFVNRQSLACSVINTVTHMGWQFPGSNGPGKLSGKMIESRHPLFEERELKPLRVDKEKVVDYLLNPIKSRGKATFFLKMGFRPEKWEKLATALKVQATSNAVALVVESPYGWRYSIDGELETPDRRIPSPKVRTVWIEEPGNTEWRLITSHPA